MRKIDKDKSKILSTVYKKWVEELDVKKKTHSHSRTYYVDVLMNLLLCQRGVCAYTEFFLCAPTLLNPDKWKNGRYKGKNPGTIGEIDHFAPGLKKARYWDWDNLFVVLGRVNLLKGRKTVASFLKPDSPGYDPYKYLDYDIITHRFRPSSNIKDKQLEKQVEKMLEVFSINHDYLCYERQCYLDQVSSNRETNRAIPIDRFFTACGMAGLNVEGEQ